MPEYFIGLMSGTSLDAIDAVLVQFTGNQSRQLQALSHPLPEQLHQQLLALTLPGANEIDRIAEAEPAFARESAAAVTTLLEQSNLQAAEIKAIGSHGQTIRHRPEKHYTLQIGDPSLIAELTGITVVSDFRRRDIAAGGQGAPLVPAFHESVFASRQENRSVVNIGGIANLTRLPADESETVTGFDTGPGNVLMDWWSQQHLGQPFDRDGAWAASAAHDEALLQAFCAEPFFSRMPPKSTGRELFNPQWLNQKLEGFRHLSSTTVQATLCRLTARSIALAIAEHAASTDSVYVCGGGVNNLHLLRLLEEELAPVAVASTSALGIHHNWVEAVAFAWLARQTLAGQPGNLPAVTGASGRRILGAIYPA